MYVVLRLRVASSAGKVGPRRNPYRLIHGLPTLGGRKARGQINIEPVWDAHMGCTKFPIEDPTYGPLGHAGWDMPIVYANYDYDADWSRRIDMFILTYPLMTFPKTTCFPSIQRALTIVMKN